MKNKILLICVAAVFLLTCVFSACSNGNSKASSIKDEESTGILSKANAESVSTTESRGNDESLLSYNASSDEAAVSKSNHGSVVSDKSNQKNKVTATDKTKADSSNLSSTNKGTTNSHSNKPSSTADSDDSKVENTTNRGAIELPEIDFE